MIKAKEIRIKLGLTTKQASELIGISVVYLNQLESGVRNISRKMLAKMCKVYNVKPNELLGYDVMQVIDNNDNEFSEQDIKTLRAIKSLSDEDHRALYEFIEYLIWKHEKRLMQYDNEKSKN